MTPANVNSVLDAMALAYLCAKGTASDMTAGSGLGLVADGSGASGHVGGLGAVLTDLITNGDFASNSRLSRMIDQLAKTVDSVIWAKSTFGPLQQQLAYLCSRANIAGVQTLDQYLGYYNTTHATKWQALCHPDFRSISLFPISAKNSYFPVKQGATYANALGRLIVGTGFTDGFAIDETKYAGGFPKLKVAAITGSGVVTVTGKAYDPATNTVIAGRTWTVTASAATTYTLAVGTAPANSLIVDVSGISAAGGISAGTMYVESHEPAGRTFLP